VLLASLFKPKLIIKHHPPRIKHFWLKPSSLNDCFLDPLRFRPWQEVETSGTCGDFTVLTQLLISLLFLFGVLLVEELLLSIQLCFFPSLDTRQEIACLEWLICDIK
jgi:hypothetical protein